MVDVGVVFTVDGLACHGGKFSERIHVLRIVEIQIHLDDPREVIVQTGFGDIDIVPQDGQAPFLTFALGENGFSLFVQKGEAESLGVGLREDGNVEGIRFETTVGIRNAG